MSERPDAQVPLSVLVPVQDEAANLRECLAGVSFAKEIVVIELCRKSANSKSELLSQLTQCRASA